MKRSGLVLRIASNTVLVEPVSAHAENAIRKLHGPSPKVRNSPSSGMPPGRRTRYRYAAAGSSPANSNAATPLASETVSIMGPPGPLASARATDASTGTPPASTRTFTTALRDVTAPDQAQRTSSGDCATGPAPAAVRRVSSTTAVRRPADMGLERDSGDKGTGPPAHDG